MLRALRGVLAARARCVAARSANGRAEVVARCFGKHVGREVCVEAAAARPVAWPEGIVQCIVECGVQQRVIGWWA